MASSDDDVATIGDYKPGSVTHVKLKNFLTYGKVEFKPGPRLNMVIGANGTGKSTILCAICLGLGGEPRLLGRADDARSFIMHEKQIALIEITLAPHPGQPVHVLQRKIDREKGSEKGNGRGASTFYINDKKVNIKEVQQLVRETYNISIDNLCTFLPQDKVGSFSGFDQQMLLTETEKTLSGSQHLYNQHMQLIEAESEMNSGDHNVETIQSKLEKLMTTKERFEREKERMEEREEALRQADLLKKKILWIDHNNKQTEVVALKEERKKVREAFKASQAALQPLKDQKEELLQQKKQVDDRYKVLDQQLQRHKQNMAKHEKKHENFDDSSENTLAELRQIDSERNTRKAAYDKAKERVETIKASLDDLPSAEAIESEYKEASQEKRAAHRACTNAKAECTRLQREFHELEETAGQVEGKLAKLLDEKAQLRQNVFRQAQHLGKAYKWVHDHRKDFRRPVWGPIACEVSMKTKNAAAFLEQHVPNDTLKAFIVEDKEDYDMLYREVRSKLGMPINIILVRGGQLKPIKRIYGEAKMQVLKKEHGVSGYLDESFSAPDAVMQALISVARVHKVLCGDDKTQHSIDELGLKNFLSEPDTTLGQSGKQDACIFASRGRSSRKYTISVSRYSGEINTRVDDVFAAKFLAIGSNPREKSDLQERLKQIHEEMGKLRPSMEEAETKKAELESEGQRVSVRAQHAKETHETFTKMRTKLANAKAKLQDAEKDLAVDDNSKKRDLLRTLMNRIAHSITALEGHAESHDKLLENTFSSAGMRIDRDSVGYMVRKVTDELTDKARAHEELEQRAFQINEEFKAKKGALQQLRLRCNEIAPIQDDEGNKLPLFEELGELPYETIEDAEAALEEAEQKANSIHNDPNAIRQYEDTLAEIEHVQAQLEQMQGSNDSLQRKIQQIFDPWNQALENSVCKVNALFSNYMSDVGCTGEIALRKGGESGKEDCDFKHWGIEIRVSFRDGQKPQVLSARVQSGGERSVSTIMYLMALQEMMVAPFRAVDEINQGLDERNERLVFRRIVQNSTKPPRSDSTDHSGQYYLITPKLLPNLVDMENEAVTPLIVFNGSFNFETPTDWNVDDITAGRKGRKRSTGPEDEEDQENNENMAQTSSGRSKKKKRR